VRRLATVLSVTGAALLLVSAPALAAPAKARPVTHTQHAKAKPVAKPVKAPAKPVKREIALTGVLSDTPTATIASDTSTGTISFRVKGGERSLQGKVVSLTADSKTVVRRGLDAATLADLRGGDHVAVKARRLTDGTWYAYRVNAAPRPGAR
jgi:hypothetical protein